LDNLKSSISFEQRDHRGLRWSPPKGEEYRNKLYLASFVKASKGFSTAFYPIHSMNAHKRRFDKAGRKAVENKMASEWIGVKPSLLTDT
jgi:hypothetical protein